MYTSVAIELKLSRLRGIRLRLRPSSMGDNRVSKEVGGFEPKTVRIHDSGSYVVSPDVEFDTVTAKADSGTFEFYHAKSYEQRYQGLSGRKSLATDGMVFEYPSVKKRRLVFRNMYFPLDVLFLDEDGMIINRDELSDDNPSTESVCLYAIEVEKGWPEEHDVSIGDSFDFKTEKLSKEWVRDPTEQAPNRWTHTDTGEYRYQETKPSPISDDSDGESESTDTFELDGQIFNEIASFSEEEILEVVEEGSQVVVEDSSGNEYVGEVSDIKDYDWATNIDVEVDADDFSRVVPDVSQDPENRTRNIIGVEAEDSNSDESVPEADIEITNEEQESVQEQSDVSDAYERIENADGASEITSIVEDETDVQINGRMERDEAETLASSVLRVAEEYDLDNVESVNVGSGGWQDSDEYGYCDPDGNVYLDDDALDENEVQRAHYSGHMSTDDPGHFVFHELGHMIHRQLLDSDRYRELKFTNDDMTALQRESIKDGMSNYASKHPLEVVAEGFAKKMAGEELGGFNEMIYEEYGGPDV